MITKHLWDNLFWFNLFHTEPIDYLLCIIASVFTVPLDIILFPIEIIAFLIYKKRED